MKIKVCQCKKEWVDDSSGFETCPSCRKNAPKIKKRNKYSNVKNKSFCLNRQRWQENALKNLENYEG